MSEKTPIDWAAHYAEYEWAEGDTMNTQVKVEDDDREWFYTAKKMYKGEMHARLVSTTDWLFDYHLKKLVPMDKITFL